MVLYSFLYFTVSILASIAGAICGIGGGVIIKPTLDFFGWDNVATISFLSGCTVFSMSAYSVTKSFLGKGHGSTVNISNSTPLAIGAVIGGIVGKELFSIIKQASGNPNMVGVIQAICLFLMTAVVLVYTLNKKHIHTHTMNGIRPGVLIGGALGISSSFLGIGGGPINLMVLGYFYSMDTKTAASNSLYIILLSQAASIITTIVTNTLPSFSWLTWALMVFGGISGGVIGRKISKRLDNAQVDKLFICMMGVIMVVCLYNAWKLAGN